MVQMGVLQMCDESSYSFGLPRVALFLRCFWFGRNAVLTVVKRSKNQQILEEVTNFECFAKMFHLCTTDFSAMNTCFKKKSLTSNSKGFAKLYGNLENDLGERVIYWMVSVLVKLVLLRISFLNMGSVFSIFIHDFINNCKQFYYFLLCLKLNTTIADCTQHYHVFHLSGSDKSQTS